MRKESYTPLQTLFNTFIFAMPCTLTLGLFLRFFTDNLLLIGFSELGNYELLLLLLFTIFSTALPYGFLNYVKADEVSPTIEGTILLLDPLLSVFWGILFFQEFLSLLRYIGVALILLSAGAMLKIETNNVSGT
jgi:drug/metabolite transporter (DMT)-like permease